MSDPTDALDRDDSAAPERAKEDIQQKQQVEDLKWLMAHAQGRRIVTRIFEKTGIRRTPFHSSGSQMAFNAGAQNVGLWLEAEVLDASPDAYFKLLKEFARNE
jgi:3-oxoacyl-[acyl-carrier-protein] synthase III